MRRRVGWTAAAALGGLAILGGSFARGEPVWSTQSAEIRFHATSIAQNLDAKSVAGNFIYDGHGGFVGTVPMTSFDFGGELLKKHFAENYAEVDHEGPQDARGRPTHPNELASVTGRLQTPVDPTVTTPQEVALVGHFICHGVALDRVFKGTVTVSGDTMHLDVKFDVQPEAHAMHLPAIGPDKLFETVEVTVDATLRRVPE